MSETYGRAEFLKDCAALKSDPDETKAIYAGLVEHLLPLVDDWWSGEAGALDVKGPAQGVHSMVAANSLVCAFAVAAACCVEESVKDDGRLLLANELCNVFRSTLLSSMGLLTEDRRLRDVRTGLQAQLKSEDAVDALYARTMLALFDPVAAWADSEQKRGTPNQAARLTFIEAVAYFVACQHAEGIHEDLRIGTVAAAANNFGRAMLAQLEGVGKVAGGGGHA